MQMQVARAGERGVGGEGEAWRKRRGGGDEGSIRKWTSNDTSVSAAGSCNYSEPNVLGTIIKDQNMSSH